MIRFPPSSFWSQSRLPEVRRGALALARRDVLKLCGLAAGGATVAVLAGCAAGGSQAPAAVEQPVSAGFFTDGTDLVE